MALVERIVGPVDRDFMLHSSSIERRELGVGALKNPYGSHPVVYSCAASIAWNIAQVPFRIVTSSIADEPITEAPDSMQHRAKVLLRHQRRKSVARRAITAPIATRATPTLGEDLEEVKAGPWVEVFDSPNQLMTTAQLWECILLELCLRGQAFVVKQGRGSVIEKDETPIGLMVFGRDGWEPIVNPDFNILVGWKYQPKGAQEPALFPVRAVVHLKRWDPTNPLGGQGNLQAAMQDVRQDVKASSWNEQFFDDGATPGGVLQTDADLSHVQADQARTTWENRHRGQMAKGWRVAVLSNGFKYIPTQASHQDMGFQNQRAWNKEAIQAVFKVPDSELTVFKNMTYANALAADRGFWTKTLIPWMRYIEGALANNLFVGSEFGLFDLSTVEAISAILQDSLTAAESLQRLGYPLNIINERLGLQMPDVDHGDDAYTSLGTVPFSELTQTLDEQFGPTLSARKELPRIDAKTECVWEGENEAPSIRSSTEPRIGGPRWQKIIDQAQARGERRMNTVVRRWFFDAMNDQLKRIRVAAKNGDLDRVHSLLVKDTNGAPLDNVEEKVRVELSEQFLDFIAFNQAEFDELMKRSMRPEYDSVALLSIDTVRDDVGGVFAFDVSDPKVLEFLADKESQIVRVSQRVHTNIREELLQGLANGENSQQLQDRIRRAFNFQASPARTLSIARTESAQTMNGTRDLIFQAEGVEVAEWVTAGDEVVRPDHKKLGRAAAKPIGFNYMELLGKPGTLEYPAQSGGPADQVINCRCVHLPVVK